MALSVSEADRLHERRPRIAEVKIDGLAVVLASVRVWLLMGCLPQLLWYRCGVRIEVLARDGLLRYAGLCIVWTRVGDAVVPPAADGRVRVRPRISGSGGGAGH